jgi:hypothetical protein
MGENTKYNKMKCEKMKDQTEILYLIFFIKIMCMSNLN